MGKDKLRRFAAIKEFSNFFEPIIGEEYYLKGNWNKTFFKNNNPIVLELGCGTGRITIPLIEAGFNVTGLDINQNNEQTYKQIESYQEHFEEEPYKNNLTYYNKPVLNQDIPHYQNINPQESFSESTLKDKTNVSSHDEYLNHINNCPSCKELLLKQFNIETERLRNDEIMELLSYIVFGIFIIILIQL